MKLKFLRKLLSLKQINMQLEKEFLIMEVKPTNFCFDKRVYSKEALMKAAYRFTDMFYIHLSIQGDNYIVSLLPKHSGTISEEEFKNELLAQMVRSYVSDQTKELRTLLMARAFSSSMIEQYDFQLDKKNESIEEEFTQDQILKDWFELNE